jgi:hypothetical protein
MTITRRQILAGAATTAAVAAMPAAVIAEQGFDLGRFLEVAVAETNRLHPRLDFVESLKEARRLSQLALGDGPHEWVWLVDEDGRPLTGDIEIVSWDDDSERESV